jgi:Pentapeptide repeats (8 copies)
VFFALVWWLVPPLLYRHTGAGRDARLKAITDTRTALLAGLVGVGALLTFWVNSRVYRITAQTLEVERGQITERYTKAIDQLGSDKLDVRLGGIYALESIAHDSGEDRQYREHRSNAHFVGADLFRAKLEEMDLGGADLQQANLGGANLEGANLQEVNLRGRSCRGRT